MMNWVRSLVISGLVLGLLPAQAVFAAVGMSQAALDVSLSSSLQEPGSPEFVDAALVDLEQVTLIRTIETSLFSPPSPDPTGIAYRAASAKLLISDSEVDETPLFDDGNIFGVELSGSLAFVRNAIPQGTNEPTGIAVNPTDGFVFLSNDNSTTSRLTKIDPGPDNDPFTADDVYTPINTQALENLDAEGLAFAHQGHLFVLGDDNKMLYELNPGVNGVYDGIAPNGDDQATTFSLAHLAMSQFKGIAYNPMNGHLYVVGLPRHRLLEITVTGELVNTLSMAPLNAHSPSDVVFAPSSQDPSKMNLYITDRGVDNNVDPNENDGRVYEVALPASVLPVNNPPVVDAGDSQTIVLPTTSAALNGTVTDDGLPVVPGVVTTLWSLHQGTGTVTFDNAAAVDTTAHFPGAGVYVLRLLADDGDKTSSDFVTITVAEDNTPPANTAPTVDAGANQNVTVEQTATLSGIASDDGLPNPPGALTYAWSLLSGPSGSTIANPNQLSTQMSFTQPGEYIVRLTADDSALQTYDSVVITVSPVNTGPINTAPKVNAGKDLNAGVGVALSLNGTVTDDGLPVPPGAVTTTWSKFNGPGNATFANAGLLQTTVTFSAVGDYTLRLTATDGAISVHDNVKVTVVAEGQNIAPNVDLGDNLKAHVDQVVTLSGIVTDDNRPDPPKKLTYAWSLTKGPEGSTILSPNQATTQMSFTKTGEYLVRLTVSDGELASFDEIVISVYKNTAPTVDAGADRNAKVGQAIILAGKAFDDNLPNPPAKITYQWSKLNGPGNATFDDATKPAAKVTFDTPGVYTLRLTANDSKLEAHDDVVFTVTDASAKENNLALPIIQSDE